MKKTPPGWPRISSAIFCEDIDGHRQWFMQRLRDPKTS